MTIKAITLDAYGTLVRNERLMLIPERIVADHGLSVSVDDVWHMWATLYFEATQLTPFRTLREIEDTILRRVLHSLGVRAPAAPYVELFFEVTTRAELYPEALSVLNALGDIPVGVVSNADHEHVTAWSFTLPVRFVLISESVKAYKPHPLLFQTALERLGVEPHDVLHVGDSDVDDVQGAKGAGLQVAWVNRDGRPRRPEVPAPDFEIADLTELLTLPR
jgi:2-haloalkanoic acid dehalogenase type II